MPEMVKDLYQPKGSKGTNYLIYKFLLVNNRALQCRLLVAVPPCQKVGIFYQQPQWNSQK